MVHFFLSRAGELNVHFSRCSRLSRFWRQNSRSPLEIRDFEENFSFSSRLNEILQTDSLLESQILIEKLLSCLQCPQFLFKFWWEIIFCYLVGNSRYGFHISLSLLDFTCWHLVNAWGCLMSIDNYTQINEVTRESFRGEELKIACAGIAPLWRLLSRETGDDSSKELVARFPCTGSFFLLDPTVSCPQTEKASWCRVAVLRLSGMSLVECGVLKCAECGPLNCFHQIQAGGRLGSLLEKPESWCECPHKPWKQTWEMVGSTPNGGENLFWCKIWSTRNPWIMTSGKQPGCKETLSGWNKSCNICVHTRGLLVLWLSSNISNHPAPFEPEEQHLLTSTPPPLLRPSSSSLLLLTCSASGSPLPSFTWMRDGLPIASTSTSSAGLGEAISTLRYNILIWNARTSFICLHI